MNTNRLEGFSDGVLAVAATLLVLNISVPKLGAGHLGHELAANWPAYAAYVTSFMTIGIIWINHHAMISRLRSADHAILILNLLLLMSVGVIPFATSLLATYLREGHGETVAALVYGGVLLVMAVAFASLNATILFRKQRMLKERLSLKHRRQIFARSTTGIPPYALATALAVVSPYATLAITFALAVFYAFPIASAVMSQEETA